MRARPWTTTLLIVVTGVMAVSPGQAGADVTPSIDSTGTGGGTFTYEVAVADGQTFAVGNFFTIYDVGPVSAVTAPAGLDATQSPLGATPGGLSPADDPAVLNITFTSSDFTFGGPDGFSVSFFHGALGTQPGVFAAQAMNDAGAPVSNTGPVDVPAVPEPMTLVLLGSGLAGVSLRLRGRRSAP